MVLVEDEGVARSTMGKLLATLIFFDATLLSMSGSCVSGGVVVVGGG